MRFMMMYRSAEGSGEDGAPPTEAEMMAMGEFIGQIASEGVLVTTDGLLPSSFGAKVRQEKGKLTVVDGPFPEAKEVIGGFAIVDVPSKETAIDIARRFLAVAGDGESEIRQMYDEPAYPPPA